MKRYMLLIIWVLSLSGLKAQELRIVEGIMYDDSGEGIPGVNIVIKNSNTGTVTNMEGYYQITAPLGSVLVFSSVGFTTQEVVVTRNNSSALNAAKEEVVEQEKKAGPIKFLDISSLAQQQGVAIMHDSLPKSIRKFKNPLMRAYKITYLPPLIASVMHGEKGENGLYILSLPARKDNTSQFSYHSVFELRQASRLPLLQDVFAQGQPENGELIWRGPHQQEIYSWGPLASALEYDGSFYPYHPQGQLVPQGNGNGNSAAVYNPLEFFQNGTYWKNNLGFILNDHNLELFTNIGHSTSRDIIPEKGDENYYGNLLFQHYSYLGEFKLNAAASQQSLWGPMGFNRMKTLGAIYRTPATFNNETGFQLPDGSLISHAPTFVDNPFGLSVYLPDQRKIQKASVGLGGDFNIENYNGDLFDLSVYGHYNYTFDDSQMGIPPQSAMIENGWLANRQYENNSYATNITLSATPIRNSDIYLHFKLRHQYQANEKLLKRNDGYAFENEYLIDQAQLQTLDTFQLLREIHQVNLGSDIKIQKRYHNLLQININQQVYTSNTLSNKEVYWLPSISGKLFLDEILDEVLFTSGYWGSLNIYSAYSRSVKEAPLIYNRWHFQGLNTQVSDYQQVFEQNEIFFQAGLLPEIIHKFDLGLNFSKNPLNFELEYFENTTENFLVPVWTGSDVSLENIATVINTGWNISLAYFFGSYYSFSYTPTISFQRNRPVVKSARSGLYPLAGFDNTFTAISEGQPLGAIYGTTYERNAEGEILIGNDGFPLKNEVPAYLGNPNPDFTMNFGNQFNIGSFTIDWVLEWRNGGSLWNGTKAYLNYLGRSQSSADLRETTGYIFSGVRTDNSINNQPVNFADPDLALSENRWVRYGPDGVGEEYVSEVSWLRLSKLLVGYEFTYPANSFVDQMSINVYANNLFFKSNYEGIAPVNHWVDDVAGQGLDFFNYPMLRTFGISTTLKF